MVIKKRSVEKIQELRLTANRKSAAPKKKFVEIRKLILDNLAQGQKTVNKIASETGINWKTVDNHIIYLIGRGYAKEVFVSQYVKIFEISQRGKDFLALKGGKTK